MEAHELDAPYLQPVPDDQAHSPLKFSSIRRYRKQAHHVVSQTVVEVGLFSDLGLCQEHEVEADDLVHPDGLGKHEPLSVADVVGPNG